MKTIYLYGSLKDQYGEFYELAVDTPAEAIRALSVQLPGFKEEVAKHEWQVIRGSLEKGNLLDEETLAFNLGKTNEVHLLPVASGAGGGSGKSLAGIALIGASFFMPAAGLAMGALTLSAGTVATVGISLALNGISTMLTPTPKTGSYGDRAEVEERPSFLFDGPVNNAAQGLAVPIVVGEIRTGSVVVSAGLTAEQL